MTSTESKPIRMWADGCFDLTHFGHANAFRQAKQMGDELIVGIHSDDEISQHKRAPVFTQAERCELVGAVKWVDKVVCHAPYVTTLDTLHHHKCDFCVHGNDPTFTSQGSDTYQHVKDAGKYREYKRTHGVSTTEIVRRVLAQRRRTGRGDIEDSPDARSPFTNSNPFLLTSQKIRQFSNEKGPQPGDRIVYIAGVFDIFHVGHLAILEQASKEGDYLIVGVYSDEVAKACHYPIMNLQERVFSILPYRYVSEVIIGAPYAVGKDLIEQYNVDLVLHGNTPIARAADGSDAYAYPKRLNKFKIIDSGRRLTTEDVIKRIIDRETEYTERNAAKERREKTHISAADMTSAANAANTSLTQNT